MRGQPAIAIYVDAEGTRTVGYGYMEDSRMKCVILESPYRTEADSMSDDEFAGLVRATLVDRCYVWCRQVHVCVYKDVVSAHTRLHYVSTPRTPEDSAVDVAERLLEEILRRTV